MTEVVKTKSSGKKNVLVMSTFDPIPDITRDDGKAKPAIIKFYDHTKGGTGIMDQISDPGFRGCWILLL